MTKKASGKTSKKPAKKQARGLGRGLSALMYDVGMDGDAETEVPVSPSSKSKSSGKKSTAKKPATKAAKSTDATPAKNLINYVAMDQLTRNPEQPRRHFDQTLLSELSLSIRDKGILQPILVRPLPKSARDSFKGSKKPAYQIIAGERRWQAALQAGLDSMPVFVRDITDQEALEIGVVENVQRADLNPMEEALAYQSLLTQFGRTQQDVATAVGKSRPYIANMLRLLNLPEQVQTYLAEGKITTGHARAIIAAPDPTELANAIVDRDLSVRDAENWVRLIKREDTTPGLERAVKAQKDADTRRVEEQLSDALGLGVDLRHRSRGGELRIKYRKIEQLEALIERLVRR